MTWMSLFAFQKISWWFAWRCSRFLFLFHDVLYRRVSAEAVSDGATQNRLASIIICLSCRSVKNSFLDLLWIIVFFLFRIIFVWFRETFSLKVRVWVLNEFNRLLINFSIVCHAMLKFCVITWREWVRSPFKKFLDGLPGDAAPYCFHFTRCCTSAWAAKPY